MDLVEFAMDLEDAFGIQIPDRDAADLLTVGQWHEYLKSRVREMSPDEVWQKETDVLCKLLNLDAVQRANVKPTDHLVRDLGFT
jgi:acyl carrier protein